MKKDELKHTLSETLKQDWFIPKDKTLDPSYIWACLQRLI